MPLFFWTPGLKIFSSRRYQSCLWQVTNIYDLSIYFAKTKMPCYKLQILVTANSVPMDKDIAWKKKP